jgi:hypothetical protein
MNLIISLLEAVSMFFYLQIGKNKVAIFIKSG